MKKPQSQVLVRGFRVTGSDDSGHMQVSILDPTGHPALLTSQQLFQDILEKTQPQSEGDDIPFVVHEYDLNPWHALVRVSLTSTGEGQVFSVRTERKVPVAARMPFGMAMPKRPRKRRKKVEKETPTHAASCQTSPEDPNEDIQKFVDSFSAEPLKSESDSSSSSEATAEEDLEEPFVPPDVAKEDQDVATVLQSHRELALRRGNPLSSDQAGREVESDADDQPSTKEKPRSMPMPSKPKTSGASFCNATLGLVDVGLQVAGRLASCRHCRTPIAKGSARFAYSFHRQKFAGWVHPDCLLSYLKDQKADLQQALHFLEQKAQTSHDNATVLHAVTTLQQTIRQAI